MNQLQKIGLLPAILVLPLLILYIADKTHIFADFYSINVVNVVILLVASPILEEIIFRGMIQNLALKYIESTWVAFIIVNVFFTLIHLLNSRNWVDLTGIFISGMIFSLVKKQYRYLIFSILVHAYYNLVFLYFIMVNNQL